MKKNNTTKGLDDLRILWKHVVLLKSSMINFNQTTE